MSDSTQGERAGRRERECASEESDRLLAVLTLKELRALSGGGSSRKLDLIIADLASIDARLERIETALDLHGGPDREAGSISYSVGTPFQE